MKTMTKRLCHFRFVSNCVHFVCVSLLGGLFKLKFPACVHIIGKYFAYDLHVNCCLTGQR